ncbi:MAG: hypothetical protein ACTSYR_03950 [Candidatus Odinarchaeia archaeon]
MRIKNKFYFFLLFIVLLSILAYFIRPVSILVIKNVHSNREYFLEKVSSNTTILINFLHSYDRDNVTEAFIVLQNNFKPIWVIYSSDSYDYREVRYNGTVSYFDSKLILRIRDKVEYNSLLYEVAYLSPQKLTIKNNKHKKVYYLQWFGDPGEAIQLQIKDLPFILFVIHNGWRS